jgi:hypothetical protein
MLESGLISGKSTNKENENVDYHVELGDTIIVLKPKQHLN